MGLVSESSPCDLWSAGFALIGSVGNGYRASQEAESRLVCGKAVY